MFISDQPEKADIIFIPGNGYPHMAEKAADLYKKDLRHIFCRAGNTVLQLGNFLVYY